MYRVTQVENSVLYEYPTLYLKLLSTAALLMIEIIVLLPGADARWCWIGMIKTKGSLSRAELYKRRVLLIEVSC